MAVQYLIKRQLSEFGALQNGIRVQRVEDVFKLHQLLLAHQINFVYDQYVTEFHCWCGRIFGFSTVQTYNE